MPFNSYIFPNNIPRDSAFARSSCLASFASGTNLCLADYEKGYIYTYDGTNLSAINVPNVPSLFGSWVYNALGGVVPNVSLYGGPSVVPTPVNWVNDAYTGTYGLSIEAVNIGVTSSTTNIPGLAYTPVVGETFTIHFKLLSELPTEIIVMLYSPDLGFFTGVWYGSSDLFGFPSFESGGGIPPTFNSWISRTFSAASLGLEGHQITGVGFGVYKQGGDSTVIFSDFTTSNGQNIPLQKYIDCVGDNDTGYYVLSSTQIPAASSGPPLPPPNEAFELIQVPIVDGTPQIIYLPTPTVSHFFGLPSDAVIFTGLTYNSVPYLIDEQLDIYKYYSDNTILLDFSRPYSPPARFLETDGTNLYTLLANENAVGIYNIGGSSWSLATSPFDFIDGFYYSSVPALVGGSPGLIVSGGDRIQFTQTVNGLGYSPLIFQLFVSDSTDNVIKIYNNSGGSWSLAQTASGINNPTQLVNNPSIEQMLVVNTNTLQVLNNSGEIWNSTSVPVSGISSLAVVSSGVQLLASQNAQNTITVLDQVGLSWSTGQVLNVTGPTQIVVTPDSNYSAAVGTSSGITFLTNSNGIWSVDSGIVLSPVPNILLTDQENIQNPYIYSIGNDGTHTTVIAFLNGVPVNEYTFTGVGTGAIVVNFQVFVNDSAGVINIGAITGNITNNANSVVSGISSSNVSSVWIEDPVDFMNLILFGGGTAVKEYYNNYVNSLDYTYDSMVAIASGAGWVSVNLQNRNRVSSMTTNPSGTLYVSMLDNEIYEISNAAIASGYPQLLIEPTDQLEGIIIGMSKLIWYNGELYSASSLYGGLVKINV